MISKSLGENIGDRSDWEFIPSVLAELVRRYDVDGFFDNGWRGLERSQGLCYCPRCEKLFRQFSGLGLPEAEDWADPRWRALIQWRYRVHGDVWRHFRQAVKRLKPDCVWIGNLHPPLRACDAGTDWLKLAHEAEVVVSDFQGRPLNELPAVAAEQGKVMRAVAPDKRRWMVCGTWLAPGGRDYRLYHKPEAELRVWLAEIVAGDSLPWWHVVNAVQEDRRFYRPLEAFFRWYPDNEEYPHKRESIASVGVIFSQRLLDYYGRADPRSRCLEHLRGFIYALIRARVPFDLVHDELLEPERLERYRVLVLPNQAILSDRQCAQLRAFVSAGGGLVATFETSLYDEWGDRRDEFGLADLFGVSFLRGPLGPYVNWYQRLNAEHPLLAGLDETTIIPGARHLMLTAPLPGTTVVLTYFPPFPVYPPEIVWSPVTATDIPTVCVNRFGSGRVAYFAADLDRHYYRDGIPDHWRVLANAVSWAAGARMPVEVLGPGLLDVNAYRQPGRYVIHLVNLSHPRAWKGPLDELTPLPEQQVILRVPEAQRLRRARLLVNGQAVPVETRAEGAAVTVPVILDHEVVVVET